MPGPWPHSAEVILLHSHQVETEYFGDAALIVGPYDSLIPQFANSFNAHWPEAFDRPKLSEELLALKSDSAITPQDVVRLTQQAFPDALATVDAGAHMLTVMALWSSHTPNEVLISNGLATMGFSLPAAIAMALAYPQRKVVCFVGDGGLGMVLAEIEVVSRLQLNIVIVVFNDATLTLIQLKQGAGQGGSLAVDYALTDFASVASAMNMESAVVRDRDEMRTALESIAQGPSLLDCRINSTDYIDIMRVARG
jgi:acetolactate synthase-1/2/3 large subunit